jgi:hypothetical protein
MVDTPNLPQQDDPSKSVLQGALGGAVPFKMPPGLSYEDDVKREKQKAEALKKFRAAEAETEEKIASARASSARELYNKYEPQFQKTPDFAPSEENKASLIGLFGLIGAIGAMGGSKSYGSALGAMNAMGGMLKGYREGRKDLFEREKAEYDKHIQAIKNHNDDIAKQYQRAMELAKTNLGESEAKLKSTLKAMGANIEVGEIERNGLPNAFNSFMKRQTDAAKAYENYAKAQKAMVDAAGGGSQGVGSVAAVQRILELPNLPNIKPQEAEKIIGRLNTIHNTERLIDEAKDPDIKFGEIGRAGTLFGSLISRNLRNSDTLNSPSDINNVIEKSAEEAGMDANDKNVVFYKKALFNAMNLEREARGGSILPQGIFQRLTPLLDPTKTTKEAFIGILQDRSREVRQATGLTEQQLNTGLGNIRKQYGGTSAAPSAASSNAPKAGKYRYNPETGEMEAQ